MSFTQSKRESPKKSPPKANYPNLFSNEYENQDMNVKYYQSLIEAPNSNRNKINNLYQNATLVPQKSAHARAKSAPKNVNPQIYNNFENPDELIDELNYIANLSSPKLNDSNNSSGKRQISFKTLQQNFEDNLAYPRINLSNEYNNEDENNRSNSNNSYENSRMIFDLNQIPLNNPNSNSRAQLYQQQNNNPNRSLSNENKKPINFSIQNLMYEAASNNQAAGMRAPNEKNQNNMIQIKRCKFSTLHQDCNRHKKYFKFNLEYCSLKEIQFFESVDFMKLINFKLFIFYR